MAESWVFDPNGTALALHSSAITIREPGVEIGGTIKSSVAETIDGEGAPVLSAQADNWTISGTFGVEDTASVAVEVALRKLGQAADRTMREGAELKRVTDASVGGATMFYDLEQFEIQAPADRSLSNTRYLNVPFSMTAKPYARQAESTLGDNTSTTNSVLVFTSTNIAGQAPALGRLVIDNDSTSADQRFVCGGIQSQHFSTADTAALHYQAEHLKPLGSAATSASTSLWSEGSFTGGFVKSTNLGPTWAGVLETMVSTAALASTSTSHMTHVGLFRAWARVFQPSGNSTGVQLRLDWSPGDAAEMTENDPWDVTVENDASLADLGMIHIPEALAG